jgi:hypothetical protein
VASTLKKEYTLKVLRKLSRPETDECRQFRICATRKFVVCTGHPVTLDCETKEARIGGVRESTKKFGAETATSNTKEMGK